MEEERHLNGAPLLFQIPFQNSSSFCNVKARVLICLRMACTSSHFG